jgi:MFS family permease
MPEKRHRFYYGWVIVAVSFFTLFLTLGIRFSFGVFYVAILREYGWGRGETAGAFSLSLLVHGSFALVTGNLIDRFGPRTLFPIAAIFLAVGLAAASRITTIWHLYLFFGVILAVGINTLAFAPHLSRIPKWFIRKRGLASGIVVSGIGVGTMVMAPLIQFLIDTFGWRSALIVLGAIILGILVPLTGIFQRRSPEDVGQRPNGSVPHSHEVCPEGRKRIWEETQFPPLPGQWTLRSSLSTGSFWWMTLTNASVAFFGHMMVVHQAAHVVDVGYSTALAASLVGLVGLLRSVGGVLSGPLSDRVGREIAYTVGGGATFVGVLLFLLVRDTASPWMLYAFVILFGLGYGSTHPILAASAADLFPGNSLGRIMGTFSVGVGIGGALGPYLGGYFYDHLGSYFLPFVLMLISIALGVLGIWMAAPRHRRTHFRSEIS